MSEKMVLIAPRYTRTISQPLSNIWYEPSLCIPAAKIHEQSHYDVPRFAARQ